MNYLTSPSLGFLGRVGSWAPTEVSLYKVVSALPGGSVQRMVGGKVGCWVGGDPRSRLASGYVG